MSVVVTGAQGFIGKNLMIHLAERGVDAQGFDVDSDPADLRAALASADFVFHLAGINRPQTEDEFASGNAGLTAEICSILADAGNKAPVVVTSSTQAERDNAYGRSKLAAEEALRVHGALTGAPVHLFRLTNVFGKWARPNYNSAVATFCHNIAHGLPIRVDNPKAPLKLVYIDDVIRAFLSILDGPSATHGQGGFAYAGPEYETTVGAVADMIRGFAESRTTLVSDRVGGGLTRALYSTYLSYLDPADFAYDVPRHGDPRGVFVEMLKTPDCGQFSYFTAGPGITRGQHYHHTKTEKFLVLTGSARFGFRHIVTNERFEIMTAGGDGRIVETIPGWTHDITNVGEDEMVVMLWANEIFDRSRPDTIAMKV